MLGYLVSTIVFHHLCLRRTVALSLADHPGLVVVFGHLVYQHDNTIEKTTSGIYTKCQYTQVVYTSISDTDEINLEPLVAELRDYQQKGHPALDCVQLQHRWMSVQR